MHTHISLRTKIVVFLSLALLLFGISSVVICYTMFTEGAIEQHKRIVTGIAKMAAGIIDPQRVNTYLAQGEKAEGYAETKRHLLNILKSMDTIKYIYVYKIQEDGCHVVFDLDTQEQKGDPPGSIVAFDKAFEEHIPTLLAGGTIEPLISDEKFGWLLTAYAPVYDAQGHCQCYAAADISMDWLRTQTNFYIMRVSILFLCVFFVLLIFCIWFSNTRLIQPINTIAKASHEFAFTNKESMEKSLNWIKSINITTADEIENLYKSFVKMANNSVHFIKDIRDKSEAISHLHRALIITLADMVESRDKNTGEHIRKTATYAEILMEEMRKEGIYTTQLTNKFVRDVVNSAPLHDIGKIAVPDAILNKPGKLTPEEFAQIQRHTTAGGEIIERIIGAVPDSDYLHEAKNLAMYHHEKWNGKGYPEGLSGTAIPLSARIMAVADVFDALVSNRSYKKGFSYEKAFGILQEERGTHFDPQIVDAFLAIREAVIQVADSFAQKEGIAATPDAQ